MTVPDICLVCGEPHKNAIRGGKVTYLRDCFKRGRSFTFTKWRHRREEQERKSAEQRLQETWK